jgi:hypothetical protein
MLGVVDAIYLPTPHLAIVTEIIFAGINAPACNFN